MNWFIFYFVDMLVEAGSSVSPHFPNTFYLRSSVLQIRERRRPSRTNVPILDARIPWTSTYCRDPTRKNAGLR